MTANNIYHTATPSRTFNFQQIGSAFSISNTAYQVSIIPSPTENRLLVALGSSGAGYYSLNPTTFAVNLLLQFTDSSLSFMGLQYNPTDSTKFVAALNNTGLRTYTIVSNTVITTSSTLTL